jgi:hypothetical protein
MSSPLPVEIDDIVQMRKPHPCGGDTWRVVRVGADIGLRCQTCNRKVLLSRVEFARRVKRIVQNNTSTPPTD